MRQCCLYLLHRTQGRLKEGQEMMQLIHQIKTHVYLPSQKYFSNLTSMTTTTIKLGRIALTEMSNPRRCWSLHRE